MSCFFVITLRYYRRNTKLLIITKIESCLITAEIWNNSFSSDEHQTALPGIQMIDFHENLLQSVELFCIYL